MMIGFGHFPSIRIDLTANHTAEINLMAASQCAASLPLLSHSLPVTCPALVGGGMFTQELLDSFY